MKLIFESTNKSRPKIIQIIFLDLEKEEHKP